MSPNKIHLFELLGGDFSAWSNFKIGDYSGYQPATYANVVWTPTTPGISCGFETKTSGAYPVDVTVEGSDILTFTWTNHAQTAAYDIEGFYMWPEECFSYSSGTEYTFTFSNTGAADHAQRIFGAYGTSTPYETWQYNGGLGWRLMPWHPYFAIVGTNNSSTVAWYASSTPQFPYDFNPESDICADWGPFTSVCNMMLWLFKPSASSTDAYNGYVSLLTTKAPLGYFNATQDAFFTLMGSSSTNYASVEISTSSLSTLYINASSSVLPFLSA